VLLLGCLRLLQESCVGLRHLGRGARRHSWRRHALRVRKCGDVIETITVGHGGGEARNKLGVRCVERGCFGCELD